MIRRALGIAVCLGLALQFFTQANAGSARSAQSGAYGISVSVSSLGLSIGPIPSETASAPSEGAVETRSCTVAVGGAPTCTVSLLANNGVINSGTFEVITQASTDPATDFPATLQSVMRPPPGGGQLPDLWTSRSYSRIEGLSVTFPVPDGTATLEAASLESESATQVDHVNQSSISATGMRLANARITITDLLGRSVTTQLQSAVEPNTVVFDQAGVRIVLWETPAPTVVNGPATMTAMRVTVPLTGVDMKMANTNSEADPAPTPAPSPSNEPSPTPTEPEPTPSPSASPSTEPSPSGLPVPEPSVSVPPLPEPSPTDGPAPDPSPTDGPAPDPSPTDAPTPDPSPTDDPTPDPSPTDGPTPDPSPTDVPTPDPSPTDDPNPVCVVDCDFTPPGCVSGPGAAPCEPGEGPSSEPTATPTGDPSPAASPSGAPEPDPSPSETAPTPICTEDCDFTPPGCIGGPGALDCLPETPELPEDPDPSSEPDGDTPSLPTDCTSDCFAPPTVSCIVGPGSRGCTGGKPALLPGSPYLPEGPAVSNGGSSRGGGPIGSREDGAEAGDDPTSPGTGAPSFGIPTMNRSPLPFTGADARTLAAVGGWLVLIGIFLVSLAHESRPAAGALRKPRR